MKTFDHCHISTELAAQMNNGEVVVVETRLREMARANPLEMGALLLTLTPLLTSKQRERLTEGLLS